MTRPSPFFSETSVRSVDDQTPLKDPRAERRKARSELAGRLSTTYRGFDTQPRACGSGEARQSPSFMSSNG